MIVFFQFFDQKDITMKKVKILYNQDIDFLKIEKKKEVYFVIKILKKLKETNQHDGLSFFIYRK